MPYETGTNLLYICGHINNGRELILCRFNIYSALPYAAEAMIPNTDCCFNIYSA